jgi:DNA-directed RNA polymerase subunit RPC12/RpoP
LSAKKTKTPEFLEKLFNRFPEFANKYDYTHCTVEGMSSRISYKCLVCGHTVTNQCANDHYQGYGCPSCAGNLRFTKQLLIEQSVKKFGNKFDFSITDDFVGKSSSIKIGCPRHGTVDTTPLLHLKSVTGCPKCYRYDAEDILERFYSNQYNSLSTLPFLDEELKGRVKLRKVTVRCAYHGEYSVALTSVLSGSGCLRCSQERGAGVYTKHLAEKNKEALGKTNSGIYFIRLKSDLLDCYKVGISADLPRRLRELVRDSKSEVSVLYYGRGTTYDIIMLEQEILTLCDQNRYISPFVFRGNTELIKLDDDILSDLIEMLSILTEESDEY